LPFLIEIITDITSSAIVAGCWLLVAIITEDRF
jgi:hypothetical protein